MFAEVKSTPQNGSSRVWARRDWRPLSSDSDAKNAFIDTVSGGAGSISRGTTYEAAIRLNRAVPPALR